MKKQTSVDWLAEWILANTKGITDLSDAEFDLKYQEALQAARKMHREEVEVAYRDGNDDGLDRISGESPLYINASDYYSQNFETT